MLKKKKITLDLDTRHLDFAELLQIQITLSVSEKSIKFQSNKEMKSCQRYTR